MVLANRKKSLILGIKIFILMASFFVLFWDFNPDRYLSIYIQLFVTFPLSYIVLRRKAPSFRQDILFFTGPIILLTTIAYLNISLIDVESLLDRGKDTYVSGELSDSDIMNYSYDQNGFGKIREKSLRSSRGGLSTGGFLFIKIDQDKRFGFVHCSIYTKGCLPIREKIKTYPKPLIKIYYQKLSLNKFKLFSEKLEIITTQIHINDLVVDFVEKYQKEKKNYQRILLFLILINIISIILTLFLTRVCP